MLSQLRPISMKISPVINGCRALSWSATRTYFIERRVARYSTQAIPFPHPDGVDKVYPEKIRNIVEEISKLTLIEVVDLNECLKKTLNIKDVPMAMGAMPVAAAPAAAEEEEAEPIAAKTSFTVKLMKFDESKKVAVIKEIKNHVEGMNLVQAKKFVEGAPQVIKADIGKDEADNIKKALEAVGGTCEVS